ncbi:DUF4892 domain-containing protein [Marinomonas sp. THO17]|uniref:DUF4892 domain-containing protein n=1 Tax=Marinomonas sp. THO17 TaxID=3149048 RepID=UPI00336BD083
MKLTISLLAILSSFALNAAPLGIEDFRDAQLIKSRSDKQVSVEVPLAKIQRSGRGWEPEKVLRLTGDLTTSLYKIDRNASLEAVYQHYRDQLTTSNQALLFECSSRNCGSSNAWANDFFGEYLLYGSEQNQSLLVVQSSNNTYQVLYINRRGAGDVMVRLDQLSILSGTTDRNFLAQLEVTDVPRIRRFLSDLPAGQKVVGFVTSERQNGETAIVLGDRQIDNLMSALGERLASRVRFINLADMGKDSLGVNRITFVRED